MDLYPPALLAAFCDISSQQLPDDFRNPHHYTKLDGAKGKLNSGQGENGGSVKREGVRESKD